MKKKKLLQAIERCEENCHQAFYEAMENGEIPNRPLLIKYARACICVGSSLRELINLEDIIIDDFVKYFSQLCKHCAQLFAKVKNQKFDRYRQSCVDCAQACHEWLL